VPLSAPALALLRKQLSTRSKNPHVFPSPLPKQPLSNMSMLMRRLGETETVHGFRSSFSDWAGEETDFAEEVAERALAHAVGDKTKRSYRRGDAFAKRRELMDAWAAYVAPQAAKWCRSSAGLGDGPHRHFTRGVLQTSDIARDGSLGQILIRLFIAGASIHVPRLVRQHQASPRRNPKEGARRPASASRFPAGMGVG